LLIDFPLTLVNAFAGATLRHELPAAITSRGRGWSPIVDRPTERSKSVDAAAFA
jgi:hypothetical protein